MTPPIEEIARGLTEAERKAVTWNWEEQNHHTHQGLISCWGDLDVAYSLFYKGLTVEPKTLVALTPLGLALRTYLQSRQP